MLLGKSRIHRCSKEPRNRKVQNYLLTSTAWSDFALVSQSVLAAMSRPPFSSQAHDSASGAEQEVQWLSLTVLCVFQAYRKSKPQCFPVNGFQSGGHAHGSPCPKSEHTQDGKWVPCSPKMVIPVAWCHTVCSLYAACLNKGH